MKKNSILIINAGSSSIKFAIYEVNNMAKINYGMIERIILDPEIKIYDFAKKLIFSEKFLMRDYTQIVIKLINLIKDYLTDFTLIGIGHRVVHGGVNYLNPILIDQNVIDGLTKLIPLAPLHQPYNLKLITTLKEIYPEIPQIACFDTAFHATQALIARKFAISTELFNEGVMRYGFHGISYEYIVTQLPSIFPPDLASGKIIVAHLGNGSSACAIHNYKSVASSMGFTALEGLMMGTRCGNIDPGVILYLLEQKKLSVTEVTKLLYSNSGLLGVSGISSDVRELESRSEPKAQEALELFCYRAARELLALCTMLQGLDAIVFTAGIGENSRFVRKNICNWLGWLGIELNPDLNEKNESIITTKNSKVIVGVIPTNEELMIAQHAYKILQNMPKI